MNPINNNQPAAGELLLREYAIGVSETARLSDRRQTVNNIYIGLNVLFLTAMGLVFGASQLQTWWVAGIFVLIAFFTTLLNSIWYRTLNRYQNLARARYEYLQKMETKMQDYPALFPMLDAVTSTASNSQSLPATGNATPSQLSETVRGIYLYENSKRARKKTKSDKKMQNQQTGEMGKLVFGFADLEKASIVILGVFYWIIAVGIVIATALIAIDKLPPVKL